MELDDLKNTWKQADEKQQTKNENIMELIQQKSYGPIAALKQAFRKQIIVIVCMATCIFLTNVDDVSKVLTNVMFWSYMAFCAGICVFVYFNYVLVKRMEVMDRMVKSNLEQQVEILETRMKRLIVGQRLVMLYFILLCEVLPYFQHIRMLDKWHSLAPITRFASYAAFLVLQYFVSRRVLHAKFGRHIDYLKELVKQMQ
jgi:hypothetical protein